MKVITSVSVLLLSIPLFCQNNDEIKKTVLSGNLYPSMTREIYGSFANETVYNRLFRPTLSSGILINQEIKKDKWDVYSGIVLQHFGLKENYYQTFPTYSDTTYIKIKSHYLTIPVGASYKFNNFYSCLGITNSLFLNEQTYINEIKSNNRPSNGKEWLIGFEGKIGYVANISSKSSISFEMYGSVNSYSIYFHAIPRYGFEFGYYTYGVGIGYRYQLNKK